MKVGQPVWYFPNIGAEPMPAVVTEVYGDNHMVDALIDNAGKVSGVGNVLILNGPTPRDGWVEEPHAKDRPNVSGILAYMKEHRPPPAKDPVDDGKKAKTTKADVTQ